MASLVERLDRALNPRTVAVVGDKGPRFTWLRNYEHFTGKIYSVQVDPESAKAIEALGIANFKSLTDIPDDIDYVLFAVPRRFAPMILKEAAAKHVGLVAMYTAGFAETDEPEGLRLQAEIIDLARSTDTLVMGPNCMGLYNPRAGVRQSEEQEDGTSGPVGFISQSGSHAINFGVIGAANGVHVSKAISMGNAVVLSPADYLDYLAQDAETRVIAMYLEGVRDGRALFDALKRAAAVKPVVVWKGGQTVAGQRAIHSHTASLATPGAIWQAVVKQTGIVPTNSLDETLDVCKAFVHTKPTTGRRMALMAVTGGQSVVITDTFEKAGLEVPTLTEPSYKQLGEFFNIIGGSYRNPFDWGGTVNQPGQEIANLRRIIDIVHADPHIDALAVEARSGVRTPGAMQRLTDVFTEYAGRDDAKPVISIVHPGAQEGLNAEARQQFLDSGIASFHSFERAAAALSRAVGYWRFRAGLD